MNEDDAPPPLSPQKKEIITEIFIIKTKEKFSIVHVIIGKQPMLHAHSKEEEYEEKHVTAWTQYSCKLWLL